MRIRWWGTGLKKEASRKVRAEKGRREGGGGWTAANAARNDGAHSIAPPEALRGSLTLWM